jgi:hypothetical protein
MSKTAILIVTHFIDPSILAMYRRLRAEAPPQYDVFLAFNAADKQIHLPEEGKSLPEEALFLCNHETLLALAYREKCKATGWDEKGWRSIDNVDTIMLSFYREHPDYDYYWNVEYDVHFEGSWGFLLARFEESRADLLATTLRSAVHCPPNLIPPFRDPGGNIPDYREAVVGFFALYRVSARFLNALDADYRKGWNGHYEFTFGSTALRHGMEIEDIGGNGPFVKPHNRNTFYFNNYKRWDTSPGNFVTRPVFYEVPRYLNTLWHPVKPRGDYFDHCVIVQKPGLAARLKALARTAAYAIAIKGWFLFLWRPAKPIKQGAL